MATAAKPRALLELEDLPVACLQPVEVFRIVAIEAMIVAVIAAMLHHQIVVLFGQLNEIVGAEMHLNGLGFIMAGVAF